MEATGIELVFLDFDGVICDSVLEGMVCSWRAYFELYRRDPPDSCPREMRRRFTALRPYVRTGEDFMVIQDLLAGEVEVHGQQEFDRRAASLGEEKLSRFRELFYRSRESLLKEDRSYWLALNRIYPHLRGPLSEWSASECFYILSTKRPEYIAAILRRAGVQMPPRRILFCHGEEKIVLLQRVMSQARAGSGLFVDDQIDHLRAVPGLPVQMRLASWGYVKPEWLGGSTGVSMIEADELAPEVNRRLGSCPGLER